MRRSWIRIALGLFLLVLLGGLVRAAPKDAHGKGHEATKYKVEFHDPEGVEVEQDFDITRPSELAELTKLLHEGKVEHLRADRPINILALTWELGVWTLAVFGLLLLILWKLAWGPMLEGLHKREENIRAAFEESRQARQEASNLRDEIARERAKMGEQIREAFDEARRDAQRLKDEFLAQGQSQLQTDRERLRREIETARDQALQELWNQTAQLATLVSARVIGRELGGEDHRRLVDEALADLRRAGTDWQKDRDWR